MNDARKISISQFGTPPLWLRNIAGWTPASEPLRYWQPMNSTSGSGGGLTLIDLGPNNWDATVGGGTPSIVNGVINGQPVLRLNGVLDFMSFAGTDIPLPIGEVSTVVIVAKGVALGSGAIGTIVAFATKVNAYQGFLTTNLGGYAPLFWGGGNGGSAVNYVGINPFDYSTQFFSFVTSYNGGGNFALTNAFVATRNNIAQTVTTSGSSGTNSNLSQIGQWPNAPGALNFPGDIAEIIIFARGRDATFDKNLQNYLVGKYGSQVGVIV